MFHDECFKRMKSKKKIWVIICIVIICGFIFKSIILNEAESYEMEKISIESLHYEYREGRIIEAGNLSSFKIESDNTLWAWGSNWRGMAGIGKTEDSYIAKPTKILDDVIMFSAGATESLAVTSNGDLWGWGNNEFGQLGDGTRRNKYEPTLIIPTQQ